MAEKEQLIAASVSCHTKNQRKHRKGTKTEKVTFININLIYEDHTQVESDKIKLNRKLNNESIKPSRQKGRSGNCNSNVSGNLQQNPNSLLQAPGC